MKPSPFGQEDGSTKFEELPYEDWVDLNAGARVFIQRPRESAVPGEVDDVTDDAACFWVWLDDGLGRVLITEGDGSTVWRQIQPYKDEIFPDIRVQLDFISP